MTRGIATTVLLSVAALTALACGAAPTDTAEPSTSTSSAPPSRCEQVNADVVNAIMELGAKPEVGKLTPVKAAAVKSTAFKNVYMVAISFTATGFDGKPEIGVWATGNIDRHSMTMSVDGFAKQFTDFPDAATSDAEIRLGDDGVSEAKACVR